MTLRVRDLIGYAVIAVIGAALALFVYLKTSEDYTAALKAYRDNAREEARNVAKSVEVSFDDIYHNLRTIAFLPSVRNIDRHGTNLDENATASIQQIYNNLASAVAVSEVYIVPATLDPDAIDPTTKVAEVPILMFDQLIVGGGDKAAADAAPADAAAPALVDNSKPEEVEIYEYHLLQKQMTWLTEHYAEIGKIKGLDVPFIGGGEVITCDNTEYDGTRVDADRMGVVLSVPFYDPSGKLKGTITAVVRTNNLKAMLPKTDYALVNPEYGYLAMSADGGQAAASTSDVAQAQPDPALLFSAALPIATSDPRSHWTVWAGHPDADFKQSSVVREISNFALYGYAFIAFLTLVGAGIWRATRRNMKAVTLNNAKLESQLGEIQRLSDEQERMKAQSDLEKQAGMADVAMKFEEAVHGISYAVEMLVGELKTDAQDLAAAAEQTGTRVRSVAEFSDLASSSATRVAQATTELSASIQEIGRKVSESSSTANTAVGEARRANETVAALAEAANRIGTVVNLISQIAGQTNLLALNATIEAARAGEAGRGFAVVASEVKGLALQTSKATDEITTQIGAIQSAVGEAVDAIRSIGGTIEKVSAITVTVASAIERQDEATGIIARNVEESAAGSRQMAIDIGHVSDAAIQTSVVSERVREGTHYLGGEATRLNAVVAQLQHLLEQLRAA